MRISHALCGDRDCYSHRALLDNAHRALFWRIRSMPAREQDEAVLPSAAAVLLAADTKKKSVPVWLARNAGWAA